MSFNPVFGHHMADNISSISCEPIQIPAPKTQEEPTIKLQTNDYLGQTLLESRKLKDDFNNQTTNGEFKGFALHEKPYKVQGRFNSSTVLLGALPTEA